MNSAAMQPKFLTSRVAQATHALIEAWTQAGSGTPVAAGEVCEYDPEALSAVQTGAALNNARKCGLADGARGLWFPTGQALAMRRELEEHVLDGARQACQIDECPNDAAPHSYGMCRKHGARKSRHGDPLIVLSRPMVPEPTYRTRHMRVAAARGNAKTHLCEGCCGGAAEQWAQIHGTDGLSPADYVPLCRKCHTQYDWASHEPRIGKGHPPWGSTARLGTCDTRLEPDWAVREEGL